MKTIHKRITTPTGIKRVRTESGYWITPGSTWGQLKTVTRSASGKKWDEIWQENEMTENLRKCGAIFVNDTFIPLWNKTSGLMFLDGGYGSSKTTYAITRQIMKCRENKRHKCYYGRQKKTEARELHDNIIREIERNGWETEFEYSTKPNGTTDIVHKKTGNLFKLFGCDDVDSLKGIDNPTDILVDEINQISFESFGMLWTRLRTPGCELQLIGCFNNCDVFPDHWLVKYIYGNESSADEQEMFLIEALRNSNIVRHHSDYLDNFFQNPYNYLQKLIIKANGDRDKVFAYCEGRWGVKLGAQPFYKCFNPKLHVSEILDVDGYENYNPNIPLHISFDENVNPYLPVLICQISGTTIYVIDEIAAENPYNELNWVCDEIIRRYKKKHNATVKIYGDATSKKEDVKLEKGKNLYTLILKYLESLKPDLRVPDSNPNISMRGSFINAIFSMNYENLDIVISTKCVKTIEDLQHTQESPDGKSKDKTRVQVNGVKGVQKYGHLSDCLDYLVCEAFMYLYILFQSAGTIHEVTGGGRTVSNTINDSVLRQKLKIAEDDEEKEEDDDEPDFTFSRRKSRNAMS